MECEGATSAEWPFMSFDFPGGIGHSGLRSRYDYWENLRAGRAMPLRREFDPIHSPALLPNIILNEVVGTPPRFRIRVEGSAVAEARGFDATGRFLDEPGVIALQDDVLEAYARMMADRRPWYSEGEFDAGTARAGALFRLAQIGRAHV